MRVLSRSVIEELSMFEITHVVGGIASGYSHNLVQTQMDGA